MKPHLLERTKLIYNSSNVGTGDKRVLRHDEENYVNLMVLEANTSY